MIKILFFADVVGGVGRRILTSRVRTLAQHFGADIVIANGENSAGGIGIDPSTAEDIYASGVDVITSGNHTWNRKDIWKYLDIHKSRFIRPLNYSPGAPGVGALTFKTRTGFEVGVLNLMGRIFMNDLVDCPFRAADYILKNWLGEGRTPPKVVFVDFHGEATSEKIAIASYLDGRVSAVVGTHTHVQTADERVLSHGTAFISDVGMCGPFESVIGVQTDLIVQKFVSGLPVRFEAAKGRGMINGVLVEVDETTGLALSIQRINEVEPAKA